MCTSPKPMMAPLASGPGTLMPGFQNGCSIRPMRARRHGVDQLVKQALGRNAALLRKLLLVQAELLP